MRKVKYVTEEERDRLVNEAKQSGEHLFEDAILTNEKYLIFGTINEIPEIPLPEPTELEEISYYLLDVDFRVVMLEMGL